MMQTLERISPRLIRCNEDTSLKSTRRTCRLVVMVALESPSGVILVSGVVNVSRVTCRGRPTSLYLSDSLLRGRPGGRFLKS